MNEVKRLGIDVGSSTAKLVLLDNTNNKLLYKSYIKHNGEIEVTLLKELRKLQSFFNDTSCTVNITGTAGMGIGERAGIDFIQEVSALSKAVKFFEKDASALIELGGEDAKIVIFHENSAPEMRMNGSCAGGTGSFIEQMASLLNVSLEELNILASKSSKILHIASRCGVFAKTDLQALINRGESKEDMASAVFRAVANQAVTTLFAGADIVPKIVFAGGPLTFFSELRKAFYESINLNHDDFVLPEYSLVLVAFGCALSSKRSDKTYTIKSLIENIKNSKKNKQNFSSLEPLFNSKDEYSSFKKHYNQYFIGKKSPKHNRDMYLGIDAGSTTTKIVLISDEKDIIESYYAPNEGNPLDSVIKGIKKLKPFFESYNLKSAYITGYGEEFVKSALGLDGGIVETLAHYTTAQRFIDKVDYIIDVGGQDIKAVKLSGKTVSDIQLNEACSSGTGSFIQTFAHNLNMTLDEFVNKALFAKHPVDLGSRCSVFMNSKVKEALKDGANVDDIAAGLCYSVIKNALYKVIKIRNFDDLGENIVVQGGTFTNDAILRAFEILTNRKPLRFNISAIAGAYGAALFAKKFYIKNPNYKTIFDFKNIENFKAKKQHLECHGCGNNCSITKHIFDNERFFYTGNRCEKYFSNTDKAVVPDIDFFIRKEEILFNTPIYDRIKHIHKFKTPKSVGLVRALSTYEHYPFFKTFFTSLGFKTILSDRTTQKLYAKGLKTITADNICFPAKIANGHVLNILEKKTDLIFMPVIIFEKEEGKKSANSFNCPIVTGYSDVLKRILPEAANVKTPALSFRYIKGLKRILYNMLKAYNISFKNIKKAVDYALEVENSILKEQQNIASQVITKAIGQNKPLILVLGRPYHLDPLVNNGILEIISKLGAYAISENAVPKLYENNFDGVLPLTQWTYHNRLYLAAKWAAKHSYDKIAVLQLNSFGCGPDAVIIDEIKSIVEEGGKLFTSVKIDEMSNTGAVKIRIRSLLETLKQNKTDLLYKKRRYTKPFNPKRDKHKTILMPNLSKVYSSLLEPVFYKLGYNLETIEKQSSKAVEVGLKYVNNDMCYPAIIIIGDILNALKSGKYNPDDVVVTLSETGGQCRASNYVPLLKKALIEAGFTNTPVVAIGTNATTSGFKLNQIKYLKYVVLAFSAADALLNMKHSTRPYEVNKGETNNLYHSLLEEFKDTLYKKSISGKNLSAFLKGAVKKFNAIKVRNIKKKKIGLVGEIYMKTNCFSNNYVVEKIESKGFEVILPPFLKFIEYDYFSLKFNHKNHIQRDYGAILRQEVIHKTIEHYRNRMNKELANYDRFVSDHSYKNSEELPIPQSIQFGEGWLLPYEIVQMSEKNITDIISVQPFGCISNHIVAKSIQKLVRVEHKVNLLILDYESGSSNVNIDNRLDLFLFG